MRRSCNVCACVLAGWLVRVSLKIYFIIYWSLRHAVHSMHCQSIVFVSFMCARQSSIHCIELPTDEFDCMYKIIAHLGI